MCLENARLQIVPSEAAITNPIADVIGIKSLFIGIMPLKIILLIDEHKDSPLGDIAYIGHGITTSNSIPFRCLSDQRQSIVVRQPIIERETHVNHANSVVGVSVVPHVHISGGSIIHRCFLYTV